MNDNKWICRFLVMFCVLILWAPLIGHADVGGFAGDNDYGGGYSDYDYDYSYDDDDDYGNNNDTYSSSNTESELSTMEALVILLALALIAAPFAAIYFGIRFIILRWTKGKKSKEPSMEECVKSNKTGRSISSYKKLDPNFDGGELCERIGNLYVQMQNHWTDKNMEAMRPYFGDDLYNQLNRQLQQMVKAGHTNYVERIAVLEVRLEGWTQEAGMDHIQAILKTRIVDYTVNDNTGTVISGNRNDEKFMTYRWSLARKTGILTQKMKNVTVTNCPNCGAPLEIQATAKCPFCDSVVTVEQEDWVIESMQGLGQKKARKRR